MNKILLIIFISLFSMAAAGQLSQSQAIDSLFSEWDKPGSPGCALGIIQDGQLVYTKGYGLANMEYDIPITPSSVFRIGSTSKQFTAACIVLLAEKGKLDLDDTLKDFFPDFPGYAGEITVRHLLNHTSGIRDYLQLAYLKGMGGDEYYYTDEDVMAWLVRQSDLNFKPGDEYMYSNSGYWLLGQIVNKVSGMNMADFARKEIFEPLGMESTHFHNDHTRIVKNRATGYAPTENNNYRISMTTLDMIGDGGIFTTISDIKKWDDAFYGSTVLGKEFWSQMLRQGVLNNGEVIEYASGLMIGEHKGLKTIRHGGAFVGFRAELLRFPEQRLSIAIFANRADANPVSKADQVADILLKGKLVEEVDNMAEETAKEASEEEFQLGQLVGDYEVRPGIVVSLTIKNDSLNLLQMWDKQSYNIVRTSGNTFRIPGQQGVRFKFANLKDGYAQTVSAIEGTMETKAERKEAFDTSGIDINLFAGSFYSKELDVTYHLVVDNGEMKARIGNTTSVMDCQISGMDEITLRMGRMRFQRSGGQISGFELDSGRVKNLKFEKIL